MTMASAEVGDDIVAPRVLNGAESIMNSEAAVHWLAAEVCRLRRRVDLAERQQQVHAGVVVAGTQKNWRRVRGAVCGPDCEAGISNPAQDETGPAPLGRGYHRESEGPIIGGEVGLGADLLGGAGCSPALQGGVPLRLPEATGKTVEKQVEKMGERKAATLVDGDAAVSVKKQRKVHFEPGQKELFEARGHEEGVEQRKEMEWPRSRAS